jgi:hypothetical protein
LRAAGSFVCASLFDEGRNPTLTRRHGQGVCRTAATKGQEIVEGLRELSDTLRAGKPLESRFTVRTYKIPAPPQYGGAEVRRVRGMMAMSQAAFAAFLRREKEREKGTRKGDGSRFQRSVVVCADGCMGGVRIPVPIARKSVANIVSEE